MGMNWHTHRSAFDGKMFPDIKAIPDEVLVYNLMAAKFAFGLPNGDKDILLDVVNAWKREASERKLHVGPRRVVPMCDRDKQGQQRFIGVAFECPACNQMHAVTTTVKNGSGSIWAWNGNYEKPTLTPSIRVMNGAGRTLCHAWVKDGKVEYLDDCAHALAGTTVDLPEV
jgi:hypothetical protein